MNALPSLTELTHRVVADALAACAAKSAASGFRLIAVDGTCGNGHDTLFLADSCATLCPCGGWEILAFDIQPAALENTRKRLEENAHAHSVRLLRTGHEGLAACLPPPDTPALFAAAMYNLGFLPGSDKRAVTQAENTLASLEVCRERLAPGGVLAVHAYGGHPGGSDEMRAVEAWCRALPHGLWTVAQYSFCNKARNPEIAFLAQRKSP